MMSAGKVVFWDFDGTLALAPSLWTGSVFKELSQSLPDSGIDIHHIRPLMQTGFPWHETQADHLAWVPPGAWWHHMERHFADVYRKLGIADIQAEEMAGRIRPRILDLKNYTLVPDAAEVLRACRERGYENWLLSNHVPELEDILRGLGLRDLLDGCLVSAQIGWDKPNPEIFRIALHMAGNPGLSYMVGDNPVADIDGAKRAGIAAILVRHGAAGDPQPPDLLSPDFTCTRLTDILDCIRQD